MSSAQDIAKQAGLNPVICGECSNKIKTKDPIEAFFQILLDEVGDGKRVIIPGLGTFSTRLMKGRTVESPALPGGKATFGDQTILRFRPSEHARRFLNPDKEEAKEAKATADKASKKKSAKKKTAKKKTSKKKSSKKSSKAA